MFIDEEDLLELPLSVVEELVQRAEEALQRDEPNDD